MDITRGDRPRVQGSHDGAIVHRQEADPEVFRPHPRSCANAEPDRGSALFLRTVPAARSPARPAPRRGYRGGLQVGLPDQGLQRARHARIRLLRIRRPQVRRRGVHPARHDVRRAAEGEAAADRVRNGRGNRRPVGQGHQGAGRLHGRHPAHDRQGHLHRQRHRAGDRLADAPLAGRLLRPRQGQDPLVGQAAVRRPGHPLSRLLARLRVRRQGHRLCPHRPSPQAAGDHLPLCPGHGRRRDPDHLLRRRALREAPRRLGHPLQARALARREAGRSPDRRRHRRGNRPGRHQDLAPATPSASPTTA